MRPKYLQQVKDLIKKSGFGTIFVPSDFYNITDYAKVSMCLTRMTRSGALKRIMRGVYVCSNVRHPNNNNIAMAIARNYGWTIIPSGEYALYRFGLKSKSPDVFSYVTDGQYQNYPVNGKSLVFKHTDMNNEVTEAPYEAALLIQVIRAIGKNNINNKKIIELAKKIKKDDIPKLEFGVQRVTDWVKRCVLRICAQATWNEKKKWQMRQIQRTAKKDEYATGFEDKKTVETFFGYNVGSKSEALIATALHLAGLNYRYEKKLYDDMAKDFDPDFTIMYNGVEYYWEHLGLLNQKAYARRWKIKKGWYDKHFPDRLLLTNEFSDIVGQIKHVMKNAFNVDLEFA